MAGKRKAPLPKFKPVYRPIVQPQPHASSSRTGSQSQASTPPTPIPANPQSTPSSCDQPQPTLGFTTTNNNRAFNNATSRHIHVTVPTRKRPTYRVAHQNTPSVPASSGLDTHPSGHDTRCGSSEQYNNGVLYADDGSYPQNDLPPEKRAKTRHRRKRVRRQPALFWLELLHQRSSRLICSKNGRTVATSSWTRFSDGEGGVAHRCPQYVRVAMPTKDAIGVANAWSPNYTVRRASA